MLINFPADLFHAVALSASGDHTRVQLRAVHFEKNALGDTIAVATSGATLACACVENTGNDFEGAVDIEVSKTLLQKSKMRGAANIQITDELVKCLDKFGNVLHMEQTVLNDCVFPDWRRAIPKRVIRSGIGTLSGSVNSIVYGWAKILGGVPVLYAENPSDPHGVRITGRANFFLASQCPCTTLTPVCRSTSTYRSISENGRGCFSWYQRTNYYTSHKVGNVGVNTSVSEMSGLRSFMSRQVSGHSRLLNVHSTKTKNWRPKWSNLRCWKLGMEII